MKCDRLVYYIDHIFWKNVDAFNALRIFASNCEAGTFYGILMIGLGAAPVFLIYLVCNTLIGVTSPCYNSPIVMTISILMYLTSFFEETTSV